MSNMAQRLLVLIYIALLFGLVVAKLTGTTDYSWWRIFRGTLLVIGILGTLELAEWLCDLWRKQ